MNTQSTRKNINIFINQTPILFLFNEKTLASYQGGGGIFYSLEYISEVTGKHSTVSNLNASDVSCFVYEVT